MSAASSIASELEDLQSPNTISAASSIAYELEDLQSDDDVSVPKISIIAMKGHPFTRKTEFGTLIAASLECPLFSLEYFLDEFQADREREEEAFRIICKRNVVIDSPLSSKWHLTQLIEVASSLSPKRVRVVIIECKPVNVYLWKMKFEEDLAHFPFKSWEDVETAIKVNQDYDEQCVQDHELVSKLVLDPLLDHPVISRLHFVNIYHTTIPRFFKAVKYMITRDEGDGPDVVVYHEWSKQVDNNGQSVEPLHCNRHGHMLVQGLEHKAYNCMACEKQVMRSDNVYNCKYCNLALHKECAESFDNNNNTKRRRKKISHFSTCGFYPNYSFPEEFACSPCTESGKGFSDKCASCLFKTHLKCCLMPTVIKHFDTEEHFLTIMLLPAVEEIESDVYRCAGCEHSNCFRFYTCQICGVTYHYECVTLPRQVKHEHGVTYHYICHECLELRDPGLWFYSRQECPYDLHPSCIH